MKKILAIALLCTSTFCAPSFAAQDVGKSMHEMGKAYRAVMKDKTLPELKADLAELHAAVLKAQAGVPDFLQSKPADDPMRKTYEEGINRLLTQLSVAQKYAEDGDYEKAHAAAAELRSLMKEYHHKLDV